MNKIITSTLVLGAITGASILGASQTHATAQNCVSAYAESNVTATISNHNTVTVNAKTPFCNDVTLYFDSYTMPSNYDGKAFEGNATATPQTKFDGTTVTLKAGSTTPVKATIKLPTCDNYQTDLYSGAKEITTVDAKGHGTAWITGEINGHYPLNANGSVKNDMTLVKDASCTPTTVTPVTPETTTPVTELASTGVRENVTMIIAAVLAAGAYGVTRFVTKNNNA